MPDVSECPNWHLRAVVDGEQVCADFDGAVMTCHEALFRRAEVLIGLGAPMMTEVGALMPTLDGDWVVVLVTLMRASDGVLQAAISLPTASGGDEHAGSRCSSRSEQTSIVEVARHLRDLSRELVSKSAHARSELETLREVSRQLLVRHRQERDRTRLLVEQSQHARRSSTRGRTVFSVRTAPTERYRVAPPRDHVTVM